MRGDNGNAGRLLRIFYGIVHGFVIYYKNNLSVCMLRKMTCRMFNERESTTDARWVGFGCAKDR